MNKTIFIRVDSSLQIGLGHVMRCLALAEECRNHHMSVIFICCELPGHSIDLILKKGFKCHILPHDKNDAEQVSAILKNDQPVDWVIVDHYALDKTWENRIRPFTRKILVIDDIANRPHACDVLLDQNLYADQSLRYQHLIPAHCQPLLGCQYALLKKEFSQARMRIRARSGTVKNILICFGGSDLDNVTAKAIAACQSIQGKSISLDVVIGSANPHQSMLRALLSNMQNANLYCQTTEMVKLMEKADLAIGGAGTLTWERFCLGLPSLVMTVAANQEESAQYLSAQNAIEYMGRSGDVRSEDLIRALGKLLNSPDRLLQMSHIGMEWVDGNGCTRIINQLNAMDNTVCMQYN